MEGQAYGKNSGALVSRECTTTSVSPGREAKRREPGIHPTAIIAAQWIPGSRCTRPGMTRVVRRIPEGPEETPLRMIDLQGNPCSFGAEAVI
jgi:hypothetical protein